MRVDESVPLVDTPKLLIDADTILYQSALAVEEGYVVVTHKETGWTKEFDKVTDFRGTKRKVDQGWIGDQNAKRDEESQISRHDFVEEHHARVVQDDWVAFGRFKNKIEDILNTVGIDDYYIVIGGSGNYRNDIAQIEEYKGKRKPKPLRLNAVKDWVKSKYGKRVVEVDGVEADDVISSFGWKSFKHYQQTGEYLGLLAYIDKDINMVPHPYIAYNALKNGVVSITPFEGHYNFCRQLLTGDSTDCIPGLPQFTESMRKKYELSHYDGVGAVTAGQLLDHAGGDVKELFKLVAEAYKSYYGTEPYTIVSWRGEELERTWIDEFCERGSLLFMRQELRKPFDGIRLLKHLGVIEEVDHE